MTPTLLGKKIGMTQIFDEAGIVRPVTVIALGPCQVMQVKTKEKDGYDAVQIGFEDKPRKSAAKPERGHAAKAKIEPKRFVKEVRTEGKEHEAGATLTVALFQDVKRVDVIGTMKGRGFAGVMKRHNFRGLETTHGVQMSHRAPGSIGCHTFPGRVIKGRKMAGQYGNTRSTIRNLKIVRIDPETNCMLVEGGVPGANGSYVVVRKTNKKKSAG